LRKKEKLKEKKREEKAVEIYQSIFAETDAKKRAALIKNAGWNDLTPKVRKKLIKNLYKISSVDNGKAEVKHEIIKLAERSKDIIWESILKTWIKKWKTHKKGWKARLSKEAQNALKKISR